MATERTYNAVSPVLLTANGTTNGVVQVTDTAGFYFGMQALLKNNTQELTVYVKKVINETTLWVGANKGGQDHNVNISAFTISTNSTLSAAEQNKAAVPMEGRLLATYETDPVNAWRAIPVDSYGNHYTEANPLPTSFSGSVSIGDVSIIDQTTKVPLKVNDDGSINVNSSGGGPSTPGVIKTIFGAVSAVSSDILTIIVDYTVGSIPAGSAVYLSHVDVSGENIAEYSIYVNGTLRAVKRTWFTGGLNETVFFEGESEIGIKLFSGDEVIAKVIHNRPTSADFESTLYTVLTTDLSSRLDDIFAQVSAVPFNVETDIINFTVPPSVGFTVKYLLDYIQVGGENIATYNVYVNGSIIARKRTSYGDGLNQTFILDGEENNEYVLNEGDVLRVSTINASSASANFEALVIGSLVLTPSP